MPSAQIRKWIKAKLAATSGVTDLVGERVYPVIIPQTPTLPAIAYFTSIEPATRMKEMGTLDLVTVQFNIVATKLDDAELIEGALRDALDFTTGTSGGFTIQEARFVNSKDMVDERVEYMVIQATYEFRMYR